MKKEKISGIYIWKNIINDKVYIGCSTDIYKRWRQHINISKSGSLYPFHQAIREFGEKNFEKSILEIAESKFLEKKEIEWINRYNSIEDGYNVLLGYNSITFNPKIEQIKQKLREKASTRCWIFKDDINKSVYSHEIEKYLNEGWIKGRTRFSDEHKKELSKSHEGITLSDSSKSKLSALWLGRNHSEKTKEEMREKLKGRYSQEWYHKTYGLKEGEEKYRLHILHNSESKKGKIWIHTDKKSKQITKEEYEKYRNDGWSIGRK